MRGVPQEPLQGLALPRRKHLATPQPPPLDELAAVEVIRRLAARPGECIAMIDQPEAQSSLSRWRRHALESADPSMRQELHPAPLVPAVVPAMPILVANQR